MVNGEELENKRGSIEKLLTEKICGDTGDWEGIRRHGSP